MGYFEQGTKVPICNMNLLNFQLHEALFIVTSPTVLKELVPPYYLGPSY